MPWNYNAMPDSLDNSNKCIMQSKIKFFWMPLNKDVDFKADYLN